MGMSEPSKADTDVRREMQLASLRYDLSTAPKKDEIVKYYLGAGVDPAWLSTRYGVDLERCRRYVAALTKQKEQQRERENAARGNSDLPEVGEVVNGA